MVSGDVNPGILDHAVEYFERKDRGEGPAAQMVRYAEPLLEAAEGPEAEENAFQLASLFWNLAVTAPAERKEFVDSIIEKMSLDEAGEAAGFRTLAAEMVERHVAMFPELHES